MIIMWVIIPVIRQKKVKVQTECQHGIVLCHWGNSVSNYSLVMNKFCFTTDLCQWTVWCEGVLPCAIISVWVFIVLSSYRGKQCILCVCMRCMCMLWLDLRKASFHALNSKTHQMIAVHINQQFTQVLVLKLHRLLLL